jgi:glycosyltransferase involved in cell wall biosynthesis
LATGCLLVGWGLRFFTVSDVRGILSRLGMRADAPTQGAVEMEIPSDPAPAHGEHLRVCLLTSNFPRWPGDATTPFVLHLAGDLRTLGVDVEVLAPHASGAALTEVLDGVPVSRFRYFWPEKGQTLCYQGGALLNLRRSWSNWLKLPLFVACELFALTRLLRHGPFDVIHAQWILPQGFVAVLAGHLARVPVVVTVHGGDIFGLRGAMLRWFKKFTFRHAFAVTANSSVTEAAVREVVGADCNIHRIPMGVAVPDLGATSETRDVGGLGGGFARTELRRRHARGNGPLLIFVGRVIEEKGVEDLIRAVALLRTELPDLTLLVVGDGPTRNAFEDLVLSLDVADRVHFTGWVQNEQVSAFLAASDIFVGPSKPAPDGWIEAQGLTFCEAMAAGLPVIATRSGGIVDIVKDGETGLLVDTGAPDQIAAAIRRLVREPELGYRLAVSGQQWVRENFSRKATAEKFLSLFSDLIGQRLLTRG